MIKGVKVPKEQKIRMGNTRKKRIKEGKIKTWKGRKHTEKSKRMIGEASKKRKALQGKNNPFYGSHRTGKLNPRWLGNKIIRYYPPEFNAILKKKIREKYNYTCQMCKKFGTHVHHINYNKKDCREENLICLCVSCHSKTNINREYWEDYFYGESI